MNIKVGDKVRIKTEQELLADGWTHNKEYSIEGYEKYGCGYIADYEVGKIKIVKEVDNDDETFSDGFKWDSFYAISEISEILDNEKHQTLDEYICSLPLEERAKWFVHSRYDVEYDCKRYFSIVTYDSYFDYGEALRATIEALKQPRERKQ